jgi:ATP-dependent helicase/nuclease subunit A
MKPRTPVLPPLEQEMRSLAIDPGVSVFLTANAGSGKTTILTQRVIRLMLEGAEPSRILCLTYTKAAAAEMQDRIFKTLGAWVRLGDAALSHEIAELIGRRARAAEVARARALFARAVETPGGLKIQTIHAFAERLLHLFPFEANVPARFAVMDDIGKAELLEKAKRATIRAAMAAPETPLGAAFLQLADLVAEDTFNTLMAAAMPLLRKSTGARASRDWRDLMAAALGLDAEEGEEQVALRILHCGFPEHLWPEALTALESLGPHKLRSSEGHFIEKLELCLALRGSAARAEALIDLFTTQGGDLRKEMLTKGAASAFPWLAAAVEETKAALPPLIDRLKRARTLERSLALMLVASDIQRRYRDEKASRALVDFDDMIDRALDLVQRDHGASWVLLKLDGGIDHVLIDEAQDTTPEMWQIVRALTAEFFAGAGARPTCRTVFAVGDEKQSIYSFQGARPESFAETRGHFAKVITEAGEQFAHRELKLSFRTVLDVLQAVDAVFSSSDRFDGLSSDPVAPVHETARAGEPGVVELWPLVAQAAKTEADAWAEVDALSESSAQVRLADLLANDIANMLSFDRFESDGKKVTAGDIMILVQRRDGFFEAMIRALKRRNVPVAGADRVRLTDEIAVRDLIAAAKVALMPEDDLALAEVLKSPLIGLTDDDLLVLAPLRAGSLHAALAESPDYAEAAQAIAAWRDRAVTATPYEFFSFLLGPMEGRRKLLSRLGPDAADGIELFLAGVLNRETREPPSLIGEIAAFSTLTTDVKRDQEQAGEAVRVLTVHGAKGLEARIVYLPDANRLPTFKDAALFPFDQGDAADDRVLLWAPRKPERPEVLAARRLEDERLKMQEYRRLFYVAMTRAKERLVIAGWGDLAKMKPGDEPKPASADRCWYKMAHDAFAEGGAHVAEHVRDGVQMLRWRATQERPPAGVTAEMSLDDPVAALPPWLRQPVPAEPQTLPPLRPSRAFDAADQRIAPERDLARQRGDLMHLLLEVLPDMPGDRRAQAAETLLASRAPRLSDRDRKAMAARAISLIGDPSLARLFAEGSRAEVPIAGDVALPNGEIRSVLGRMDRLAVDDKTVILADFKTGFGGARAAAVTQLALYRALLQRIYPARTVQALLIWTASGRIDTVSPAEMDAALHGLVRIDALTGAPIVPS